MSSLCIYRYKEHSIILEHLLETEITDKSTQIKEITLEIKEITLRYHEKEKILNKEKKTFEEENTKLKEELNLERIFSNEIKRKNEDILNNITQMTVERNELMKRIEILSDIKGLSNKDLLKNYENSKKENESLNKSKASLDKDLKEKVKVIEDLKKKYEDLQKDNKKSLERVTSVEKDLKTRGKDIEDWRTKSEKFELKLKEYEKNKNIICIKENEELKIVMEAKTKRINDLEVEIKGISDAKGKKIYELEADLKLIADTKNKRIVEVENELKVVSESKNKKIIELETNFKALESIHKENLKELEVFKENSKNLNKNEDNSSEIDGIQKELDTKLEVLNQTIENNKILSMNNAKLKQEKKTLFLKTSKLVKDIQEIKNMNNEMLLMISGKVTDIFSIIDESHIIKDKLFSKEKEKNKENSTIFKEIEVLNLRNSELENQLAAILKEKDEPLC